MKEKKFASFEEVIRVLQELSDDFESVEIPVPVSVQMQIASCDVTAKSVGALIRRVGGGQMVLNVETTERLLNDGILNRMGIPVKLR